MKMSLLSVLALERCHNPYCRYHTARSRLVPGRGITFNEEWFCCPSCFEAGVATQCASFLADMAPPTPPKAHRMPLGLLMLSRGWIDLATLRRGLQEHAAGKGRIGEVLRRMGAVTEQQVTSAVAAQWQCPVFPLRDRPGALQYAQNLPLGLLERYRALPIHFVASNRLLLVAFAQEVSSTLLYATQEMLGCTAEACIADESAILQGLAFARANSAKSEFLLPRNGDPADIGRSAAGYAQKLSASHGRLLLCGQHLWLRLNRKDQVSDFLFPIPSRTQNREKRSILKSSTPKA